VRQQQQGHGNPILSWMDEANASGSCGEADGPLGKNWVIFPNFLDYFMRRRSAMNGRARAQQGPASALRWLQKTQAYSSHKPGEPKVKTIVDDGFIACWLHLAYALY